MNKTIKTLTATSKTLAKRVEALKAEHDRLQNVDYEANYALCSKIERVMLLTAEAEHAANELLRMEVA